jgi:hypothetical protein
MQQLTHAVAVCLFLAVGIAHPHLALSIRDRSGAFIGYSEGHGYAQCHDKLRGCEKDASMNKCLLDPYKMRRFCPVSCSVSPCVNTGTVLVSCTAKQQQMLSKGVFRHTGATGFTIA